jgi:hypothetical protein
MAEKKPADGETRPGPALQNGVYYQRSFIYARIVWPDWKGRQA